MGTKSKEYRISVRDLVEWVLRRGSLGGVSDFSSSARLIEATRAHQRVQKSRPTGYEPEVSVKCQLDLGEVRLVINGRVDGVLRQENELLVEEIKTVTAGWNWEADPLHWAQVKCYAAILLQESPVPEAQLCLTYYCLSDRSETPFRQRHSREELSRFFNGLVQEYAAWVRETMAWEMLRDQSIQPMAFPYLRYRPGQRKMAVAVYRALAGHQILFACAPTGIGKTISVLFPAVKAIGQGIVRKVFFLTAKNSGAAAAEKAVSELCAAGAHLRTVVLTAKEKICFCGEAVCDPSACQYATNYYDRIKSAIKASLDLEKMTREVIERIARQFTVCPFELSVDLTKEADIIIGDYNYVFDPQASLKRLFKDGNSDFAFLIDEAHHLVDRAREMFSASLTKAEITSVQKQIRDSIPRCAKTLNRIKREWAKITADFSEDTTGVLNSLPDETFSESLRDFLREAEQWLLLQKASPFREELIQLYFRVSSFVRVLRNLDARYRILSFRESPAESIVRSNTNTKNGRSSLFASLKLFCMDPSLSIQQVLDSSAGCVFFSATLLPTEYFRNVLLVDAKYSELILPSPFSADHLKVIIHGGISTRYHDRQFSHQAVAESIFSVVHGRAGNYIAYFPSYEYLSAVLEAYQALDHEVMIKEQKPNMDEKERQEYLGAFNEAKDCTLVGFAVMGGIFGESIDLVGDQLIGAIIVGVGLPQICLERNLIREYYQSKQGAGFEFAYQNPGFNRVLQAVGRVIRSEKDRGVVLLIDNRLRESRYKNLFPEGWKIQFVANQMDITEQVRLFWGESTKNM